MKYKKMLAVVLTTSIAASAVPMTAWAEEGQDSNTESIVTDMKEKTEAPKEDSVGPAGESDTESVAPLAQTDEPQENAETAENTAGQQEAKEAIDTAEKLQEALNDAKDGDTITLGGSFELNEPIEINKKVTLDGNNNTITVNEIKSGNVITVLSDDVQIVNLNLKCEGKSVSGIHVYQSTGVQLENVNIEGFRQVGVLVNGSEVVATGLETNGETGNWGAVAVSKGKNVETTPKFELVGGTLNDAVQIYDESGDKGTVVTVPKGWKEASVATEKDGSNVFHTNNIEKLAAAKGGIYNTDKNVIYDDLAKAVNEATTGDTIKLCADITLQDKTKGNTQGIVTIANKTLTIDGNGHNITVAQNGEDAQKASAFNIEGGADVTFKNVKLDANKTAKHGFNVYGGTVKVEDCTIKKFNGYAIVGNSATVTVDGLETEENAWGAINIDCNIDGKGSSFTMTNGNLKEDNSICIENAKKETISATIAGGTMQTVQLQNVDFSKNVNLEIKGGDIKNVREVTKVEGQEPVLKDNKSDMIKVTGGTFSNSVAEYSDKKVELNSDGEYTYYETVEQAKEAAKPGDTIKDTNNEGAEAVTQVQVTWDANGGTLLGGREETEICSAGDKVVAPDASRSRYRFRGWTDEDGKYVDFNSYILSEDEEVTFTAQWKKKSSSSGGSSSSGSSDKEYSIAIDKDIDNGKVKVDPSKAEKGDKVTITVTPDKGYEINKVTVKDADGDKLELKEKGKGEYTFTMPDSKVEVKATFVKAEEKPETPAEAKTIILTIDQKIANVFGEYVVNDVAPIIRNERTMLPIRFIAQNLGAEVAWDDALNKVTITKDDLKIELYINSAVAVVNGENVTLDAPAFIENSRTYLPLRFVAENLGATVTWDAAARQVTIQK